MLGLALLRICEGGHFGRGCVGLASGVPACSWVVGVRSACQSEQQAEELTVFIFRLPTTVYCLTFKCPYHSNVRQGSGSKGICTSLFLFVFYRVFLSKEGHSSICQLG